MSAEKPTTTPPDWEETKRSLRRAGKVLVIPGVILAIVAGFIFTIPLWQRGDYPREVAESTPNSLLQIEGDHPGTWAYVDADLQERPLGECVKIDGALLKKPWQCVSADESHVFTFRDVRRGGLQEEALVVDGVEVPVDCTRTGDWNSQYYCAPLSAIPDRD